MTGVKMITCCYCGARDALRMGKGARVTLSCLTCGAPVRKMEDVRIDAPTQPVAAAPPKKVNKHRRPEHFDAFRKRKKKKKKSGFARLWDKVDDVFDLDDIFDFD
ncbi:MAG: hypothetical protein AAF360_16170 [Pseudomonadota bacterium]